MALEREQKELILSLKDELSANLKRIDASLGQTRKAGDDTRSSFQKFQDHLKQWAMPLMALRSNFESVIAVFKRVADTIGGFISDGAESIASMTRLSAVFRASGGDMRVSRDALMEMNAALAANTAFTDENIAQAQSLMLTYQEISGEVFPRVLEAAADLASVMGTDIVDAAQSLAMAMTEPAEGLTRLRRSGIMFTEEEKDQIKALDDAGLAMEAQAEILENIESKVAGVAREMNESGAGALAQYQKAWEELSEAIGTMLIDMLEEPTRRLTDFLNKLTNVVARASLSYRVEEGTASPQESADYWSSIVAQRKEEAITAIWGSTSGKYRQRTAFEIQTKSGEALLGKAQADPVAEKFRQTYLDAVSKLNAANALLEKLGKSSEDAMNRFVLDPGGGIPAAWKGETFMGAEPSYPATPYNAEEIIAALVAAAAKERDQGWMPGGELSYPALTGLEEEQLEALKAIRDNTDKLDQARSFLTDPFGTASSMAEGAYEAAAAKGGDAASGVENFFSFLTTGVERLRGTISGIYAAMGDPATISAFISGLGAIAASLGSLLLEAAPLILLFIALKEVFDGMMEIIGPSLEALWKPFKDVLHLIGNAIGTLLLPIFEALEPLFVAIGETLERLLVPLFRALQPIFDLIGVLLMPLVTLFDVLSILFEPLIFVLEVLSTVISAVLTPVVGILKAAFDALADGVAWVHGIVSGFFTGIANAIIDVVNSLFVSINDVFGWAGVALPMIPKYEQGGYVPNDGLAYLHAGEYVVPRKDVGAGGGDIIINAPNAKYIDAKLAADLVMMGLKAARA